MHPFGSAVNGEDAEPGTPLSDFLGPSFSPSATESSSPLDSVLSNPTLFRCSSGLIKIIRATTGEKHLLELVFLVHKSARYLHLFGTPAFELTATDSSFDGKICC